eukprot:gb/GEZJ01001139.1/.p1 GENE.gb/GEZJ01001139.1/~~gb/GEZJ01001139.1/.p1  ORF type:complete len:1467 (-),score=222.83 gb/GEZJ01001139.1/:3832-8232(-)
MASPDTADVIGNVVRTFESDASTDAVESLLRSMQSTTITLIIGSIRNPPSHISPIRLLRALWSVSTLRPTILTNLSEAMSPKFTQVDASLLEEVDFLLVADARNSNRSHERRLKDISLCASSIAKQSKEVYSPVYGPLLVYCARAASMVSTLQARDVRTKILQFLLISMCDDENIAVQAVIALLENELGIADEEEKVMMNIILRFVSTNCLDGDLPDVLRAILFSLTKTNSSHKTYVLSWLVFVIIRRATGDVLGEVINVVDVMVLDSEVVCDRIATAFWSIITYSSREGHSSQKRFRFSPSHIAVLYCILSDASTEAQQEYLYHILERILLDPSVSFDISTAASSSASAGDVEFRRKATFVESIKIPGVQNRSQTIVEFYENLLWKSKKLQDWGSMMLLELFAWVAESRRSILNNIFGTIVQTEATDDVVNAFCTLYERITSTPRSAFALRDCQGVLKEALELVSLLPAPYDYRVLKASVPIFVTCPNLTDFMLMYLRKASGSRSRKFQIIACTGLLTILEQDFISKETAEACCATLKLMMQTSDNTVKSYLITYVLKFLRRKPRHAGRISDLSALLMKQFMVVLERPDGSSKEKDCTNPIDCSSGRPHISLNLANCFGEIYGEYILREPVSLLAKFCFTFSAREERMDKYMKLYITYLGNPSGALSDACLVSTSKAPILPRVKTLSEQFDVLFGTGSVAVGLSHCLAYGLCLIIRDHLDGRSPSGKSNDERSKRNLGQPPQFASMTAREAASKLHSYTLQSMLTESITFRERLEALKITARIQDNDEVTVFLKKKICSEVLRRLQLDLKADLLGDRERLPKEKDVQDMVLVLCSLYCANCPWLMQRDSETGQENIPDVRRQTDTAICSTNSGSSEGEQDPHRVTSSIVFQKLLSHSHLSNDIRSVLEPRQLLVLGPSLSIAVRHSVLSILITLYSYGCLKNEMKVFVQLLRPVAIKGDKTLKEGQSDKSSLAHQKEDLSNDEMSASVEDVVHLVLKTIRLEFANSMSVGLTLSYLELVSLIIEIVRGKGEACLKRIGAQVFTAITDILREYSVRHATVLREMLRLCLKCLETRAAMEFIQRILVWLGNSSSLLNSRFSVEDFDDNNLNVVDFDPDIVAEGRALDAEFSDGEERDDASCTRPSTSDLQNAAQLETHTAENRASKPEDDDRSETTEADAPHSTQESGSSMPEGKSVTSLCLDETAEVGLLSIVTVLGYCQGIVNHEVRKNRMIVKEGKDSDSTSSSSERCCSARIASILRDFCNTSFAKLVSPKQRAWPDVLVKKVDYILLGLLEYAELKLRFAVRSARRGSSAERCTSMFRAALSTLQSLYDESASKSSVFATTKAMSRLNKASLEEKLKTTSLEVSQVVREKPEAFDENTSRDWKAVVKNLNKDSNASISRALGTLGKEGSEGVSEHLRVSHPRKRQRLRSRNSGIDDWLQDERGDDNFADLEDFIVPMDAIDQ